MERRVGEGVLGHKQTVLIVEDNELNREVLRALLENDFDVLEAVDGEEGLEMLAQHYRTLAIVLLDVYMPRCDGFEFLQRKRLDSRYDSVPVIVTTASDALEDEHRCLELGANDFVIKPYNADIIKNRIANMIHLRRSAAIVNQLTWDANTGLYNKEFFFRSVAQVFETNPQDEFDLVCSDIENFKALNDRYGELVCDQLLHDLAECLSNTIPDLVAAGRIGGDTFAFLIAHQERGWEHVLDEAIGQLPYASLMVKIGIVAQVDHELTVPMLCNRAICALETIKGRTAESVAWFDDELHQRLNTEQTIRETMEAGLAQGEFVVFFQPKYDVHRNTTGGAEALVRWIHPTLGFVSPGVFIPIFERSGFITKLDMFVWEETCRVIRRCQEAGLPTVPISVNVSRLDFDDPDLADKIAQIAHKHGVSPDLLHAELTETAYSDNPSRVTKTLSNLKSLGFHIELDDFGAGFSTLASLNILPLDVMKLDMSMIRQATLLNDFRIVEAAINLARVLGLKTVVEGVETHEEAQKVTDMGCDLIQGYYYSKPLRLEEFEQYMSQH